MGHTRAGQAKNKAMCVPYCSHTLNMVVADAAKSSVVSIFLGVLQRLYNLFSSSVQRWAVLQENVRHLTVKSLSVTRLEIRIDRFELPAKDHTNIVCSPNVLSAEEELKDNVHSNKHKG